MTATLRPRFRSIPLFLVLLLTVFSISGQARDFFQSGSSAGKFLPVDQAFRFSAGNDPDAAHLSWQVTPGYYLYRGRIRVTSKTPGVTLAKPEFSISGTEENDPYFGKVTVFFKDVSARVGVKLPPGTTRALLDVTYQGCAKAGLCYPPQHREVTFRPPGSKAAESGTSFLSVIGSDSAAELARFLKQQPLGLVLAVFFALGLGLTFTPCVLPMLPIISTLVGSREHGGTWTSLGLAIAYVVGMAVTYSVAGVVTGLLGASFNVQALLQSPWALGTASGLFVLLALGCFGLYELQLPGPIRHRLQAEGQKLRGGHLFGVFGIGVLSALVVSPCVTPPLAGALLYISATQAALRGGLILLALALGMGVPLIAVAVAGRRILPRSGPWLNAVKGFYGILLLAVAIWLVQRLLPAPVSLLLWAALAGICGVQLGAFDAAGIGWPRFWKGVGLLLFLYGGLLLAGALGGAGNPLRPLQPFIAGAATPSKGTSDSVFQRVSDPDRAEALLHAASRAHQPAILDFYADWCISCQEMEHNVFDDPGVRRAMRHFRRVQLDLSANSKVQQQFLEGLDIFGPPAVLFFDPRGHELKDLRLLGDTDRAGFLAHLNQVSKAFKDREKLPTGTYSLRRIQ